MRVCPKCGTAAADEAQRFCLMDGSELVSSDSEPTVVMDRPGMPQSTATVFAAGKPKRKRRLALYLILGLVVISFVGALLAGVIWFAFKKGFEQARIERGSATPVTSSTPRTGASQTPPTRTAATPADTTDTPQNVTSPGEDKAADTGSNTVSDEITPIQWSTAASYFKMQTGLVYRFECPPGGTTGTVWGTDIYTADSSICTAAVHAGKIDLTSGGPVTIEFRPGRQIYGSTTRHGVTTNPYPEYPHSFVFR